MSPENAYWPRGYVHVYTGEGKGKTTAALGLALRAAGAGLRVFLAQWLKAGPSSEVDALARFADRITLRQYGTGRFVRGTPRPEDVAAARQGLREVRAVLRAEAYRLVILDEINMAAHLGLLRARDLVALVEAKPDGMELVFTGRNAPEALLGRADLVTDMRCVRHYFDAGVRARRGIER